jgi:hypothetical protein
VERRKILQEYDDILDVEIISSPPLSAKSVLDEEITIISHETLPDKPTPLLSLGGAKFRRKTIMTNDISSPLVIPTNNDMNIDSHLLFDSQDSIPSTLGLNAADSILLPLQYGSSVSTTSGTSSHRTLIAQTSSGETIVISKKPPWKAVLKAQERRTAAREQKEAYYGVDIHGLLDTIEGGPHQSSPKKYFPRLVHANSDMTDTSQIPAKIYGPINIGQLNSLIYSAMNVSTEI